MDENLELENTTEEDTEVAAEPKVPAGAPRLEAHSDDSGKRMNILLLLLIYTGLFAVIAAAVYFLFIYDQRTFIRFGFENKDTFSQRYIFQFQFRRFLENLFTNGTVNTWDWSIGLGADSFSFNISNLVNPLSYICAFTPDKYVDVVYSLTIVARVYFSGLTFILFARKVGFTDLKCIMGGLLYAFSPWIIWASVVQGIFITAAAMLPLVLLGEEKILRGESPALFSISVAYSVLITFMLAYAIGIITIIYFFIRYLTEYRKNGAKNFFKRLGIFMGFGAIGILMASLGFIGMLMRYGGSTTATGATVPTLFSIETYLRIPLRFVNMSSVFGSNSVIAVSALGIALMPVIILCFFKRKSFAVMTGLLFVLLLFPKVNSVFNFFSYASGRWMFAFAFFYVLATLEAFDKELLSDRRIRIAMAAYCAFYSVYLIWIQKIISNHAKIVLLACWVTVIAVLVLILIAYRGTKKDDQITPGRERFAGIAVLTAAMLGLTVVYNLRNINPLDGYTKVGEADKIINASAQRIGKYIDDDDFFRVDQVGDLTGNNDPHCKINEAMYFGNRSNYVFISSVDNDWFTLNRNLGNNQGYYKRVAPNSNDDRFGIDFLQGFKYFIGDDRDRAKKDTTPFAAYGFGDERIIDNVELMTNKYSIGLGCMFSKYMRESEWLKLNYADREYAMMMAVVLDDEQEVPAGLEELKAGDIKTGVKPVKYKISDKKRIEKGDSFVLSAENDDEHQLLVSFKGVRSTVNGRLSIAVSNGKIRKTAIKTLRDARGFPDIEDLTFNVGRGADAAKELNVELVPNGQDKKIARVKYDELEVLRMPLKLYDKLAKALEKQRFVVSEFKNDIIKGTVKSGEQGILYLSVPDDGGWEIKVDGEKAEKIKGVDYAFIGVPVGPGTHEIELEYHSSTFVPGMILSLLGIILFIVALAARHMIIKGKRDKNGFDVQGVLNE